MAGKAQILMAHGPSLSAEIYITQDTVGGNKRANTMLSRRIRNFHVRLLVKRNLASGHIREEFTVVLEQSRIDMFKERSRE